MTKPLADIRVLDLSIVRAGPVAVRLLADWGADVIRIEQPRSGDSGDVTGSRQSSDAQNLHRNKRGITLDLKHPKGYEVLERLVRTSDVLVENFKTDVKHRLKIDYESLAKVNPRLIVGSVSGFGQKGPYAERAGFDQIVQGMSGLMSLTGVPDGDPMRAGIAVSDTSAGMFLGQGILLALLEREQTGRGQWVHTSLLEAMLSKLDFQGSRYTMDGDCPDRHGNHHPTAAPMGVFRAADGFVNLAATSARMWRDFCTTLELKGLLEDSRFETNELRVKNREALVDLIESRTSLMTQQTLIAELNAIGCPCGPIYSVAEAFDDPQTMALEMRLPTEHSGRGLVDLVRSPINLSNHPNAHDRALAAPRRGQHTSEILRAVGLTSLELRALKDEGII
ncbi:MAG: formyl-CoA transferase [Gammaproteobacteria bacterium]|mgnify:FL=1|nr:formyl-CoA transferase [Gammaproteobacteria bacterium]|tara:strand:+ start:771 stop:1952 length:1182 start_codon:yes stop_codon:yes gene_type:complete